MSDPDLGDEAEVVTVGADEAADLVDGASADVAEPDETIQRSLLAGSTAVIDAEVDAEPVLVGASAASDSGRSRRSVAWLYLLALFAIAGAIVLAAVTREDEVVEVAVPVTTPDVTVSDLTAVDLEFVVDGDTVTLRGAVPDEDTRDVLVDSASGRYLNVVDQLVVDPDVTLDGGRLHVSGAAFEGDDDAPGLQADAAASLGLEAGDFDVEVIALDKTPVAATVRVSTDNVVLNGAFPDQASLDEFQAAAVAQFGAAFTDTSGLSVDSETTLTNSTITISGTIDGADFRAQRLAEDLTVFFGSSTINSDGVVFDTTPPALARIEERLRAQVSASPILFDSGSAEILPESDAILQSLATALIATPGVPVEIEGHTDNTGDAGTNQLLSEDRAEAVVERLVALGVDESRLTFVGVGPNDPIADNDTDEGKAANRRIEFQLEGAEEPPDEDASECVAAEGDETDEADAAADGEDCVDETDENADEEADE